AALAALPIAPHGTGSGRHGPRDAATPLPAPMTVPLQAIEELRRVLEGLPQAQPVWLDAGGHELRATAGDVTLSSPLMAGEYPDLSRIVPQAWRTRATLQTGSLRAAARATTLHGRIHPLLLDGVPGGAGAPGQLRLFAPGSWPGALPGAADAEADLPAAVEGRPGRVVLSAELLLPFLEAATAPQLELHWTTRIAPVLMREKGHDAPGAPWATWLIMPMHAPEVEAHVFA
ncbi:MAG TPA: hypothetical protein VHN78_17145, partial [Chloroflexota bacterium]|nr:hypothetical protein [Chloroflexota bacterium]